MAHVTKKLVCNGAEESPLRETSDSTMLLFVPVFGAISVEMVRCW